jgi:hypothetical protein
LSKSACGYHPKSSRRQWSSFAACRLAGQVGNLRPIGNRPAATCP